MRFLLLSIFFISTAKANLNFSKDLTLQSISMDDFSSVLTSKIFEQNDWPETLKYKDQEYKLNYTFNEKLTTYINRELRRYRSDYASVVVIDNNNGQIIAATDYTRDTKEFGKNMAFSTTHPAASVFKIVTAADLLENTELKSDEVFSMNGRGTTLYKSQLEDTKNRWTRSLSFNKAFAYSNNVIFGKAAIHNSTSESLHRTAHRFGFGDDGLVQLLDLGSSQLFEKDGEFALAELASGFNRKTMISPVHGAMLASVVVNDGYFRPLTIFKSIENEELEQTLWKPKYMQRKVISKESSEELQQLMELTVSRGTARGAFRPRKMKRIKNITVGGKTGSITGGVPYGKRDWFVSFARPDDNKEDKGISVCVMIVNVKKWYIKSTYMAKNIIEYYYTKVKDDK